MKYLKTKIAGLIAIASLGLQRTFARGNTVLANAFPGQLGGMYPKGEMSLVLDTSVALPVANRYLVYTFGADQYHAKPAGVADLPLGVSPDSPSGTIVGSVPQLAVWLFGTKLGTVIGIAAGAVTHGNPVGTAANGFVQDLTLAGNGNYWLLGYALNDVTIAGAEVSINHAAPRLVTITAGAISAVLK